MSALAISPTPEWRDRFWARTQNNGSCIEWNGARHPTGYGACCTKALRTGKKMDYAHRIAYAMTNGPIPAGMYVCHHCDNPSCVNPDHLFLGTQQDNMDDRVKKHGRKRGRTKVTDAQVEQMKSMYAAGGVTFYDLGTRFNISFQHAHALVRGKR